MALELIPGSEEATSDLPQPGALLDARYRVESILKVRSERIAVYRAFDERLGRTVKVKWRPEGADDRWERREAALLLGLDHPRVPRTLDAFERGGARAYVQTYFEGPTVREVFRALGRLEPAAVYAVLDSVLVVLEHLHGSASPLLHRDIKPGNLVCLADGEVALIDFGIAREGLTNKRHASVKDLTQAHTVGYAPPEQVIGLEASPASDTYALGATALYLLSGLHPVQLWDAGRGRLMPPEGVPAPLAEWLRWVTAPSLDERCPSARAAREALAALEL